ncbi:MAG: DNA polymerase domain-containing protein [Candidatus Bathyarchaeota archaeon]
MTIYYLLDAEVSEMDQGIKLTFFDPSENKWKELLDTDYLPYFLIPYPIPKDDLKVIDSLNLEPIIVEKIDLFTRKTKKFVRINLKNFSDPNKISRKFSKSWEKDIPIVLSYIYDKNLVFGAQYKIQGNKIHPFLEVSKEDLETFRKTFSEIRKNDPEKYKLSKKLFILCSQPVPIVSLEKFGIKQKIDSKYLHSMFMLARLVNIPISDTYHNRKVSKWIKSIFHYYLRKKNILIPTAKELRKGEKTHSVKGALTLTPEPGIHFNTVVVDFDSMYPSLIDSYNLSHETIDCSEKECQTNKIPELDHFVCTKLRGVYSILIGSLKDLRIHWFKPQSKNMGLSVEKRSLAKTTSDLLKLILVSSYGVVIRIHGISRSLLGESITAYGRYSLRTAYKIAKNNGLRPIYGDTDSLFLENPNDQQIEWLMKTIKTKLKLDLSVEERYNICVLPQASKAYFGIRKDGTVDIKGLTAIKSNSPNFINNVFSECIQELKTVTNEADLFKAKKRIKTVVNKAVTNLKLGKVPLKDLEYIVVIHENPKEKLKGSTLHQPYQCAFQLLESGKKVK